MEQKRKLYFGDDLKTNLKKGVDILCDAVKTTMGPDGKLVLIQKDGPGHPIITKDGVTVANSIFLEDEIQNLAAKVIKEAASRTADEAGDGTTTSTVLAQKIYEEGLKMLSAGYQLDSIKKGIDLSLKTIKSTLSKNKKITKSSEILKHVANISANGEKEIADLIVNAIEVSGIDGNIVVEHAKGFKSDLITVDGFNMNRGFLSPYFVTNKDKMSCEFEKPLILLADREFNSIHELMKPLEISLEASRPILIIANELAGDALQGLVLNKTKGTLRACAIKSPGFGISRHDFLNDLLAIVGGTLITDSFDMSKFEYEDFGIAKKALINRTNTMLMTDTIKNENVEKRISIIKESLSKHSFEKGEKEILQYRLRQLMGGISILMVGASTESELIERFDRVDDALHATKAAMQEGVLPGCGIGLLTCQKELEELKSKTKELGVNAGIEVMIRSIDAPFRQILKNSSKNEEKILNMLIKDPELSYDVRNNKFGNFFEIGVIDPHKVVRCAIENATSAASMLLSVGCCMINAKISQEL